MILKEQYQELLLSEVADTVLFHPLDYREIIGDISDVIFDEERMVILDFSKTKKIFVYDHKGQLQFSIGSTGAGPGEFIFPKAVTFTNEGDGLLIYCDMNKRVLKFDWRGEFVKEYNTREVGEIADIIGVEDGYVVSLRSGWSDEGIVHVDNEFNVLNRVNIPDYYTVTKEVEGMKTNHFIPKKDGSGFYFNDLHSNFLLDFEGREIKKVIEIDLPDHLEVDLNITGRNIIEVLKYSKREGKMFLGDNHIDMGEYLVLDLPSSGQGAMAIYDKKKGLAFPIRKIENDLSEFININGIWGRYNNHSGQLMIVLEPPMFNQVLEQVEIPYPDYKARLDEIKVDNSDNPILIIYKFKSQLPDLKSFEE